MKLQQKSDYEPIVLLYNYCINCCPSELLSCIWEHYNGVQKMSKAWTMNVTARICIFLTSHPVSGSFASYSRSPTSRLSRSVYKFLEQGRAVNLLEGPHVHIQNKRDMQSYSYSRVIPDVQLTSPCGPGGREKSVVCSRTTQFQEDTLPILHRAAYDRRINISLF